MTNKKEDLRPQNSELRTRPAGALCIDIGNSQTVLGLFEGEELIFVWRLSTEVAQEYWQGAVTRVVGALRRPAPGEPYPTSDIRHPTSAVEALVIASVVPLVNEPLCRALQAAGLPEPLFVTTEISGLKTEYRRPEAIGADRVANAVAAIELYALPAIIVDLGTAITVDAVSADGVFLGGAIAPGVEISANALTSAAALLPEVSLVEQVSNLPPPTIGRDTVEAMQSGILYGAAAMIDGLVERIADELELRSTLHSPRSTLHVICTGGLAERIAPLCKTVCTVDPHLTLKGLRIIGERQIEKRQPQIDAD